MDENGRMGETRRVNLNLIDFTNLAIIPGVGQHLPWHVAVCPRVRKPSIHSMIMFVHASGTCQKSEVMFRIFLGSLESAW